MSGDSDGLRNEILTQEEFQEALRVIVMNAYSNGVGIRGSWPVMRQNDPTKGWEIAITNVSCNSH